jgi:microcin C transport system substrate-binding protein
LGGGGRGVDAARRRFHALVAGGLAFGPGAAQAVGAEKPLTGEWVPAYAAYGRPALGPGFTHFPYADPDAPKGGTLYLPNPDRRTSFDKFNYFTLKGNAPAGVMHFMHETLAARGADEELTMYGLLAEAMWVAPDLTSIAFRLHPKARFSNGDPVHAEDIRYTFDCLSGPLADPIWAAYFVNVAKAVVVDARTIRFELKEPSTDTLFRLGTLMPVFSRRWAPGKAFDQIVTEHPLATGPYTIARADSGRRIEFQRNPDYWARELPVRRGFFNWDRVVYRYYEDEDVSIEALKAGEFDLLRAWGARIFVRRHAGPKWDDGRIVKQRLKVETGQSLQSYQLNLRRPVFQDIRVRQALLHSYDFETDNRYKLFERANSLFSNSDFAATGLPSAGELKILEPFREQLPKEVFGPPFVAPRTDGDPHALRRNLLKARALLAEAGWRIAPDGVARNAKGEALEFEYLAAGESTVREEVWQRNLGKLGIRMKIRKVDFALYDRRLREFDFDVATIVEGTNFTLPAAGDYQGIYHSRNADQKGSNNLRGTKLPAADRALDAMERARTLEELKDACRALDRVIMWNHGQVPELYAADIPVSYWNKFGRPAKTPRFFTVGYTIELDPQIAWIENTWWLKR